MRYKVIVDSCGELTAEMKASGRFETASLGLEVGDCHIIDDESFNQAEFLKNVAECPTCPKSSCPSPETFMEGYHCDAEHVYAITVPYWARIYMKKNMVRKIFMCSTQNLHQ